MYKKYENRVSNVKNVTCRLMVLLVLFGTLFCSFPKIASAIWPVSEPAKLGLGFEQSYKSSLNKQVIHRGVDVIADSGMHVVSPQAGKISFVGRVPADSTNTTATMLAVSVKLENGKTMTFMPFNLVMVKVGASVKQGLVLGSLAPHGDYSSPETHLHVGLKDSKKYYDPLPLMQPVGKPAEMIRNEKTLTPAPLPSARPLKDTSSVLAPSGEKARVLAPAGQGVQDGATVREGSKLPTALPAPILVPETSTGAIPDKTAASIPNQLISSGAPGALDALLSPDELEADANFSYPVLNGLGLEPTVQAMGNTLGDIGLSILVLIGAMVIASVSIYINRHKISALKDKSKTLRSRISRNHIPKGLLSIRVRSDRLTESFSVPDKKEFGSHIAQREVTSESI